MARKRMIDPSIWESEDFSKLSLLAKLIFIGMFSLADDEGRGRGKPAYLRSKIFPYEESMRAADIEKTLQEIASNMSTTFYSHDENIYYQMDHWSVWQKIDRPQPSRIPPPENADNILFADNSTNVRRSIDEDSTNDPEKVPPNRIEENKNRIEEKEVLLPGAEKDSASGPPVASLILNDKSIFHLYQKDVEEYAELYPAVDVAQEFRNMAGWCKSNSKNRKTRSGVKRFINGWLTREQNKGGRNGTTGGNSAKGSSGQNARENPYEKYGNYL